MARVPDYDEVVRRYTEGESAVTLSRAYGVSANSIYWALMRRGVTIRPAGAPRKLDLHVAARLYADGMSTTEVGKHFGADGSTVRKRFKAAGIPLRTRRQGAILAWNGRRTVEDTD